MTNAEITAENYLETLFQPVPEGYVDEVEAASKEKANRAAIIKANPSKFVCPKCDGKGHLPHYQHIKAGECFYCGGSGVFYHSSLI